MADIHGENPEMARRILTGLVAFHMKTKSMEHLLADFDVVLEEIGLVGNETAQELLRQVMPEAFTVRCKNHDPSVKKTGSPDEALGKLARAFFQAGMGGGGKAPR